MSTEPLIVDVSLGNGPCYVISSPSGASVNFGAATFGFTAHLAPDEARELASALIACANRSDGGAP